MKIPHVFKKSNEESNEHPRCHWVGKTPLYIAYHDQEWGVPLYEERALFEMLVLESLQAGLSWLTVLKKREHYRACFEGFHAEKIVTYDESKVRELLLDPGLIRSELKMRAIVENAAAFLALQEKVGSVSNYLWQFVQGKPIINAWQYSQAVPTQTAISDQLSKDLKGHGFKFIGSTTCYAFMQAVGMVNDHLVGCYRHPTLMEEKPLEVGCLTSTPHC